MTNTLKIYISSFIHDKTLILQKADVTATSLAEKTVSVFNPAETKLPA